MGTPAPTGGPVSLIPGGATAPPPDGALDPGPVGSGLRRTGAEPGPQPARTQQGPAISRRWRAACASPDRGKPSLEPPRRGWTRLLLNDAGGGARGGAGGRNCRKRGGAWGGGVPGARVMDRYAGSLEEMADGTRQQQRHYQLLSALQSLVKELPKYAGGAGGGLRSRPRAPQALTVYPPARSSFQQRLPYTMLSDLALALLDGTVFKIVQGLLEIQHLTEKSLYNQRLSLQNEHRGASSSGSSTPFW
ncbi:hypothetical protein P7K49_016895 [Saguinus oedipus]|uniref:Uncharacterized protein n=1 Tax=Saguinus oedipus TaxID=9490 RepID=A0ABQ9VDD3_SAGOE|nr:hypothetical protein P7K49_016895 [Saguinus oedipus]